MPHIAESGHSDHGSFRSYTVGLLWSLGLTLLSFGVVMTHVVAVRYLLPAIVVLAVVQLVVQLIYFLHLGTARSQRSNSAIFLFTALLIAIMVSGSLWVMHNANINMMPTQMSVQRALSKD
ncbi:MAG TPA: cytochrome o ubiquinol oxidase subunit IV [Rhizomicrobium sp.]